MKDSERKRLGSPTGRSVFGVVPEISLDDRPLLDHVGELRLGRLIQNGLRRLTALLVRHPDGYGEVAARLAAASRGQVRIMRWGTDRERLRRDSERAFDHLAACERSDLALPRRMRHYRLGVRILDRYPLDPEFAMRLARQLGGSRARDAATWITRLEHLIRRVERRVLGCRDELTRSNERLILREALRCRPRGLRESDLYQEGFIGLQRAAMRFDPGRNLRFSTYATFWVRQSIRQCTIDQSRLIRVPQRTQLQLRKWQAGGETRLDAVEAERVNNVMHRTVTFSFVQDDDEAMSAFDRSLWHTGPSFAPGSLPKLIEQGLKRLSARERRIVQRRFGLDGRPSQTLESIGREMQLSRERVRQLEREAIGRLRRHSEFEEAYENVLSAS